MPVWRSLWPVWSRERRSSDLVPLEEALGLFEEGTALMKQCSTALDKAEQKVAKLLPGLNGAAVEEPMEEMEL